MIAIRPIHIALVLASSVPLWAAPAATRSGELTLAPSARAPGARVQASYRGGEHFERAQIVVLRARLRTPGDQDAYLGGVGAETRRVAELVRGGDGVLRGSFRWPDSVVYAVFAVETPDGRVVDTRGNAGWELLAHEGGAPSAAALDQRARDLTLRNPLLGLATAREAVRRYSGSAAGWLRLWFFEGYAGGLPPSDTSAIQARRTRFAALGRAADANPRAATAELGALADMARGLKDEEAARKWEARILREHPRSRDAAGIRMRSVSGADSAARLGVLERLWTEFGAAEDYLVMAGMQAALQAGDANAVVRWSDRAMAHVPILEMHSRVARDLAMHPVTREEGARRIRRVLARIAEARDGDRDLFRAAPIQRDRDAQARGELLAALGSALRASGREEAALDTLRHAAKHASTPDLLREIAGVQLAAGDTAGAVGSWARAAAGAEAPAALADSVRAWAGAHFDARRWAADVDAAREELGARVRRAQVSRPLPALRLVDASGAPAALAEVGEPTVVVFGSSGCGFSVRSLPELDAMAAGLRRAGVRTVLVTEEAPSAELGRFFAERGFSGTVLFDPGRASHAAFGSASTPEYFVVDAAGAIRFEYSSLPELRAQVAALTPAR